MARVYIAGFGSLLSRKSALSTFPDLQDFQVGYVYGYRRVFCHVAPFFIRCGIADVETKEMASLSAEPVDDHSQRILVTIFSIPSATMDAFYEREPEYRYVKVHPKNMAGKPLGMEAVMCAASNDDEYKARLGPDPAAWEAACLQYNLDGIWRNDIMPCRVYTRHCVLSAAVWGPEARANFLDTTFLADRRTSLRAYLEQLPALMEELPPAVVAQRYGGPESDDISEQLGAGSRINSLLHSCHVNRLERSAMQAPSDPQHTLYVAGRVMHCQDMPGPDVAHHVWPGSMRALAVVQDDADFQSSVCGQRCVELGAGVSGLMGLVSYARGARDVAWTDMDAVVPLLAQSLGNNIPEAAWVHQSPCWTGRAGSGSLLCCALDWNDPKSSILSAEPPFDVVVSAEVVYQPQHVPLVRDAALHVTRVGAHWWCYYRERDPALTALVQQAWKDAGWVVRKTWCGRPVTGDGAAVWVEEWSGAEWLWWMERV